MFRHSSVFFGIFLSTFISVAAYTNKQPARVQTVTNEDIRDAILQVVNVVRTTEDKLERHEYRERVLGEHLKRGILAIDKRIKQWDHFKGTEGAITRLDERLAAVETILMQKDEKERIQMEKIFDTVEDIKKNLPSVVDKMKNDIIDKVSHLKNLQPPPPSKPEKPAISKNDIQSLQKDIVSKIEKVTNSIQKMEKELEKLKDENKSEKDINKKSLENLDKVSKQLNNGEKLLVKYENKLADYNNKIPDITPPAQIREEADWQKNFLQSLNAQKHNLDMVITGMKSVNDIISRLPDRTEFQTITTKVKDIPQYFQSHADALTKSTIDALEKKLIENNFNSNKNHENMTNSVIRIVKKLQTLANDRDVLNISDNTQRILRALNASKNDNIRPAIDSIELKVRDLYTITRNDLGHINATVDQVSDKVDKLSSVEKAQKLETMSQYLKEILNYIQSNTNERVQKTVDALDKKISEINSVSRKNHEELKNSVNRISNVTETLNENLDKNQEKFKSEINSLNKVDEVMVKTADSVLDTKRRVEYGVHQIMSEVSLLIKASTKDITNTISDRFDVFELSVLDENNGAFSNITAKIGDEIDQVWRQIGIMHKQMGENANSLNKLQNQTDVYVNGSVSIMDRMKGKVGKITSKISELDENLNFLLGRLLLVTHEFNQIKTGLGDALDQIKGTFHSVQEKINASDITSAGPHQIPISETPVPEAVRKREAIH